MSDSVDRFARGELSAAEARELAREALDSQDLFDELTGCALGQAALPVPRVSYRSWYLAIAAVAAALVVAASLYFLRPAPGEQVRPALASMAAPGQPLLLAAGLDAPPDASGALFRGADASIDPPRQQGSIVSVDGGEASVNLGSVDGLKQGLELQVLSRGRAIGKLEITTVFRDHARGRVLKGGRARAGDEVRAGDPDYLNALLEQAGAVDSVKNPEEARAAIQRCEAFFENADLPAAGKYGIAMRLGALEYRAGSLPSAEQRFAAAAALAGTNEDRAAAWNRLGVVRMLRGDLKDAEAPLEQSLAASRQAGTLNNLGVWWELRGDRRKAAELYAEAEPQTAIARTNLERIKGSR